MALDYLPIKKSAALPSKGLSYLPNKKTASGPKIELVDPASQSEEADLDYLPSRDPLDIKLLGSLNKSKVDLSDLDPDVDFEIKPSILRVVKDRFKAGGVVVDRGRLGRDAWSGKFTTPYALKESKSMRIVVPPDETPKLDLTPKSIAFNAIGSASEMLPFMGSSFAESAKAGAMGAAAGAVTGVALNAAFPLPPQAKVASAVVSAGALAKIGAKAGMTYGAFKNAADVEMGNSYLDMLEHGIPEETAKKIAPFVGMANGAIEVAQLGILVKYLPGGKKLVGKGMESALKSKTFGQLVTKMGSHYLKDLAKETGQEVAQEGITITGEELALAMSKMQGTDAGKIMERLGDTAVQSALGFSVIQMPGTVYSGAKEARRMATDKSAAMPFGTAKKPVVAPKITAPKTPPPPPPGASGHSEIKPVRVEGPSVRQPSAGSGLNFEQGDAVRMPVGNITEEFPYQIEGRGGADDVVERQIVDGIKLSIQKALEKGEEIPRNITDPIIINKVAGQYFVIDGHHRYFALKESGASDISAIVLEVSDEQARQMAIEMNFKYNNPPSVQGTLYRKDYEKGMTPADIITKWHGEGHVTPAMKKQFDQWIALTYLPPTIRAMVDGKTGTATMAVEIAATIGGKMRDYKLALSAETVLTLYQKYHQDQGLSSTSLGKVIDTIFSVAGSKTVTKETQMDLFGAMVASPEVLLASTQLEKARNKAVTIKNELKRMQKRVKKGDVNLEQPVLDALKREEEAAEARVNEMNEKLYKFKLDDFVGPVKQEIENGQVVEGAVEPGALGTDPVPAPVPADVPQEVVEQLLPAGGELFPIGGIVNKVAEEKGREVSDATLAQQEAEVREVARDTGVAAQVGVVLASPTLSEEQRRTIGQQDSVLAKAVSIQKRKESKRNEIDSQDREKKVYAFEAALTKYGIDKNELGVLLRKAVDRLKVLRTLRANPADYYSYAYEGLMKAMGASIVVEQVGPVKAERLVTEFDPNNDKNRGRDVTEKFFNYGSAYIRKWIVRYGLPTERRNIYIPNTQITESLHNFVQLLMEIHENGGTIEERWSDFMPKSLKYSVARERAFLAASKTNAVSLDAPTNETDDFSMMDTVSDGNSIDADVAPDGAEDYAAIDTAVSALEPVEVDEEDGLVSMGIDIAEEKLEISEEEELARKKGIMAVLDKRMSRLNATEKFIVRLAFGLSELEYGRSMAPEEIADVLNAQGMGSDRMMDVSISDLFGGASAAPKVKTQRQWTEKQVENILNNALLKMGDLTDLELLEQNKSRADAASPNQMGDIWNEGGRDVIPNTETPEELEEKFTDILGFRRILGNRRGAVLLPDLDPVLVDRLQSGQRDFKWMFSLPFWIAQRNPLFAPVFNAVLKYSVYGYNRYRSVIGNLTNNFKELNSLGLSRANRVSEIIYKNAGKEEFDRAKKLGVAIKWYTPDQLRDFGLDDDQIRVFHQIVRTVRYEVGLLKKQYRIANDYYKQRDGESVVDFQTRRNDVDKTISEKFPEVYFPIFRFGDVWVHAKKLSHYDKKGKPVYEERVSMFERDSVNPFNMHKTAKLYMQHLSANGWQVSPMNAVNRLRSQQLWESMDLYQLERLLEYAGIHWPKGAQQSSAVHQSDLKKLKDYVDKVRAGRGGISGHFLKRDWVSGYRTDAEHLKKSLISFGEGAARSVSRLEGHKMATEELNKIPHGQKSSRAMRDLYDRSAKWLDEYQNASSTMWSGLRLFAYIAFLGFKLGFMIQQLVQPMTTTLPRIAKDVGHPEAEAIHVKARLDSGKYFLWERFRKRGDAPPFSAELMRALRNAQRADLISGEFTDKLLNIRSIQANQKGYSGLEYVKQTLGNKDAMLHIAGIMGIKAEKINRTHAFLSGWEVGLRKGLSGSALYDHAVEYVNATQWSYGSHNLPMALYEAGPRMRGVLQTVFMFGSHPYNFFSSINQGLRETLGKTAAGQREWSRFWSFAAPLLVVFFGFTGLRGVPLYSVANGISVAKTGHTIDLAVRETIRKANPQATDEDVRVASRMLVSGYMSHVTKIDFASMLGMGNLIPIDYADTLDELAFGPIYNKAKVMFGSGASTLAEGLRRGDVTQALRGAEQLSPVSVASGAFKAIRLKYAGANRTKYGTFVKKTTGFDLALALGGMGGIETTERFMELQAEKMLKDFRAKKVGQFNRDLTSAIADGDSKREDLVWKDIAKWNSQHRDDGFIYKPDRASIKEAVARYRGDETYSNVPKALRAKIRSVKENY